MQFVTKMYKIDKKLTIFLCKIRAFQALIFVV